MDPRTHIPPDRIGLMALRTVSVPVTGLYRDKSGTALDTQLLMGTKFIVHEISDGWAWGQEGGDQGVPGYVGFIRHSDLSGPANPTHQVVHLETPIFARADIKSPVKDFLPINARLRGRVDGSFMHTELGYVHVKALRALDEPVSTPDFVGVAERLTGRPYVWGGISARGLDCSGLVQTSMRAVGLAAPRDSDQQAEMGSPVSIEPGFAGLQRGDLVFWPGHVGIMQSAMHILHANAFHMCVESEPLNQTVMRLMPQSGAVTAIRRL